MLISLQEFKEYLRIDSEDEDELLIKILAYAEKTCADILRTDDISEMENTENVKMAELYAGAYMYEHREEADHNKMNMNLRAMMFSDRKDMF